MLLVTCQANNFHINEDVDREFRSLVRAACVRLISVKKDVWMSTRCRKLLDVPFWRPVIVTKLPGNTARVFADSLPS